MIPGRALHRLAARICSAKTLERAVEPTIADLQKEYVDAKHQSRSRRVVRLLTGYLAVLKVIAMTAIEKPLGADDERHALIRTFAWAAGAIVCASGVVLVLTVVALRGMPPYYTALMTPMMLPIAIPIGLTLGIAFGLSGRTVSRHTRNTVLVGALLATVVSYSTVTWGIAFASQSFRQSMSNAVGAHIRVSKGLHEISVSEAQRERTLAPGGDPMGMPRRLAWTYHIQLAMSFAAPVLALLALGVIGRGARRAVVLGACAGYYILLVAGERLVYQGLPAIVGAWLPNAIFVATATYVMSLRRPPSMESSFTPAP
jgi:Lipopolysaccharide export system permease LptF/LptG